MRKALLVLFLLVGVLGASIPVPAVTNDGGGLTANLVCEVSEGKGRILVATEPLVGLDTQQSEKRAVEFVKNTLGVDLSDKDIVFIFETNLTKSIDGGSAGAAMALCLLSELTNRELNPQVSITGTIEEDGSIGFVGGILSKARAVSETSSVFLVPKGQIISSTYSKKYYSPRPGIYIDEIYPVKINVSEYALENLGIQVVEVSDIADAEKWFFSGDVYAKKTFSLELPILPANLPRIKELAEYEIERAEKAISNINLTTSQELLDLAISVPEGYYYTQANYAFLSYVTSTPTYEDVELIAEELNKQFTKIETSDPNWRGEAELRLSWALFNNQLTSAKKEWLMLSAKMLSLENFTGEVIENSWVKDLANERILQAKEEVERAKASGATITEAESSLNFAVRSFDSEMYFASLYNAIDSIAWSRASEASTAKIYEDLINYTDQELEDEFSESYRRHALYLGSKGETRGAAYSLYRALLREDVFEEGTFILPSFKLPTLSFDWLIIVLLAYLLFTKRGKKKQETKLNQSEMLILSESKSGAAKILQNKLRDGEIDEKTYHKLLREIGG
ncbi:MAG: hypothetical protein GOU98_03615 [Candidatus Altiarchaeota archaeon]|nr:hypothetical protein [Candidatus Altiarchaeota archaeon]